MFVDACPPNLQSALCQNCVRYPPKPRSNTTIYGDTPMHIVVAEIADGNVLVRFGVS
jgi:hypothetical protein